MITPEQMQILNEQPTVAENMERFGGSFIQNIGRALLHADYINAHKNDMHNLELTRRSASEFSAQTLNLHPHTV